MRGGRLTNTAIACMIGACLSAFGCGGDSDRDAIPPEPDGLAVGFNEDPTPGTLALQEGLGMPLRRFKVPWSFVERTPDRWNWTAYDRVYRAMLDAGLRPLVLAIGAPCWTRPGRPCAPGPPDPEFDSRWAEYIRRLTERYPDAVGIEVWNEPNIAPQFPPRPDPTRFAALLESAYDAVNEVNPDLPVVSGGLFASARSGPFGMADSVFLSAMLAAGVGDSLDAIGAHPYPRTTASEGGPVRYDPVAMERALERLRSVRDSASLESVPIWITEMGVSTTTASGFPPAATETQQAELILNVLRAADRADDIQVALVHSLIDAPPTSGTGPLAVIESGFGVYTAEGEPKAAACAVSDEFDGSLSC